MAETVTKDGTAPGSQPGSPAAENLGLEVHDVLPEIVLPDSNGAIARLSAEMSGRKLLLLFCADPRQVAVSAQLQAFARLHDRLSAHCVTYAVTMTPPEVNQGAFHPPLPMALLSDVKGQVFQGMGLRHADQGGLSLVVTDENCRILRIDRSVDTPTLAEDILTFLDNLPIRAPRHLGLVAPVLHIPHVFEPEFCASLIDFYEQTGGTSSPAYLEEQGVPKFVYDGAKVRQDCRISDEALIAEISRRVTRRVVPGILKAFTRLVTGIEKYKIGCYDAREGGRFDAHRDNISQATAHRRFAMSINLNTGDYEGGHLRFAEFGPDLYRPDSGDAIVYSSSLLHEVTPVTVGRRYTLLAHMYDEESRALNPKYRKTAP